MAGVLGARVTFVGRTDARRAAERLGALMASLALLALLLLPLVALTGCAAPRALNQPLDDGAEAPLRVPRADMTLWQSERQDKPFIGIALSGGGSRAAVFGWAVLQQLEAAGLLSEVEALSSVSGGSLAAGLYALRGHELQTDADWQAQQQRLSHDFLSDWLQRLIGPASWVRGAVQGLTRTQLMAEVFDDVLFGHATYADLGPPGPRRPALFVNATRSTDRTVSRAFVFDNADFEGRLGSRLDRFPLAQAVMASGAFPGVFGNVPLRNYRERLLHAGTGEPLAVDLYEQVYDGGPADNLGVWTLIRRARERYQASVRHGPPLRGCLIIAIDAHAANDTRQLKMLDVDADEGLVDRLVKPTAWDSIDALLYANRVRTLQALNLRPDDTEGERDDDRFVAMDIAEQSPGARPSIVPRWVRAYQPVARFPLFGPQLPWDANTIWAEPEATVDDTHALTDDEVAALYRGRIERTRQLERAAPDCVVWHLGFERLRSVADYRFVDGTALQRSAQAAVEVFRKDHRRERWAQDRAWGWSLVGSERVRDAAVVPDPPLERLRELADINALRQSLWALTGRVDTSYHLTGPKGCTPGFIRSGLEAAAQVLVAEDRASLQQVCNWYRGQGLPAACTEGGPSLRQSALAQPWFSSLLRTDRGRAVPIFLCRAPPDKAEFERALEQLQSR